MFRQLHNYFAGHARANGTKFPKTKRDK